MARRSGRLVLGMAWLQPCCQYPPQDRFHRLLKNSLCARHSPSAAKASTEKEAAYRSGEPLRHPKSNEVEKPQGGAAIAAALLRRVRIGSLHRNAFSRDIPGYLELEVAGRVVEIQGEGTGVRIAAVPQSERFTEVDGSHEVSVRVIVPHAVRELVSPVRGMLPHPQADVARSRINIRVVNLGAPGIPELVRFLDGLTADRELDVPKANDGRFAGLVSGRLRVLLYRTGLTLYGSSLCCHRGEGIAARR